MDRRWTWLFLVLIALVAAAFFTKGLWPVDETRYAEVGREVLSQKSVFLLTKNAEPYSHKPPLYPWLMALGYAVFGVHDWIPKAIPMLFSLLCVWAGGLVYRDLYGRAVPGLFKVVLLSSLYFFLFSFYAMFDVQLTFVVLVATHFYLNRQYLWYWVMLGLGILTKGPVILIVAGLPVLVHLVREKGWKSLLPKREFWLGFGIMLAVVAAWLAPLLFSAEGGFIKELLIQQQFGRISGASSWAHGRPVYWYLLLYPVLAGPWALLWYANGFSRRFRREPGDRFIYGFILVNLAAFSLISGKQMHYLIPTIPFLAFWIARHSEELSAARATKVVTKLYGAVLAFLGAVFVWFGGGIQGYWQIPASTLAGLEGTPPLLDPHSLVSLAWVPVGLTLAAVGLYGVFRRLMGEQRLMWLAATALSILGWLSLVLVPTADSIMNPRPLAERVAALRREGMSVAVYAPGGTYNANLNFYARTDHFPVFADEDAARTYLDRPERPLLVAQKGSSLAADAQYEAVAEGWDFGYMQYVLRRKE